MSAEGARVLEVLTGYLMREIAPHLGPGYRQASVGTAAAMLASLREEWDRIAERLVDENTSLRRLFGGATSAVSAVGLRARLEEAGASEEPSLRIAQLEQTNDELRALLIDLHAHVEESEHPAAARIEREIWSELVASTERRRLPNDPF